MLKVFSLNSIMQAVTSNITSTLAVECVTQALKLFTVKDVMMDMVIHNLITNQQSQLVLKLKMTQIKLLVTALAKLVTENLNSTAKVVTTESS